MSAPDWLLTPAEAAAVSHYHTITLAKRADAGRLNAVRTPGGTRRYWRSEIHALAAANRGDRRTAHAQS
jgi:predicted site-specific integrase-resolvase